MHLIFFAIFATTMIEFEKRTLANGLTVIAHTDDSTPMAAVNILYKVGSRNEEQDKTGFAHLFEHLMFSGSPNVPEFDVPIQIAGGENNAFTNNDYTNYYIAIPKENIETALWAESDRMITLNFDKEAFEVQRKVVIEEFSQRYLNQPYGDLWLLLRPLCYKVHPYQWATIGKTPEHIESATMEDVKSFFKQYYTPNNAILSIAGNFTHDEIFALAEKWFGGIPSGECHKIEIAQEPMQNEERILEVERDVPVSVIYIAFKMAGRASREFAVCDVISDILSNGTSSRLYQRLVKDNSMFSSVNAYITGELDAGLFVVTGRILEGVSVEDAEKALWAELSNLDKILDYEMQKVKNKFEANNVFGEINVLNKAMNLAFFEMVEDAAMINQEVEQHNSVTHDEIVQTSQKLFRRKNSNTLRYMARNSN